MASKYVISAAHCFFDDTDGDNVPDTEKKAEDIAIRIGDHNLDSVGEETLTPKTINIAKLTNHPDYNKAKIEDGNDIAVLELAEEVDLNVYTPACMAKTTDSTTFDGKTATVAGWGLTSSGGSFPSPLSLRRVDVPVIAEADCKYKQPSIICAGFTEGGKDACQVW